MHAVLDTVALKAFARLLAALRRVSPNVVLEPHPTFLRLSALSDTHSAYLTADIAAGFFASYRPPLEEFAVPSRISLASFCDALGRRSRTGGRPSAGGAGGAGAATAPMNSAATLNSVALTRCVLEVKGNTPLSTGISSPSVTHSCAKLVVKLSSSPGLQKCFEIPVATATVIEPAQAFADQRPSEWVAAPGVLLTWLSHFPPRLDEVSITHGAAHVCVSGNSIVASNAYAAAEAAAAASSSSSSSAAINAASVRKPSSTTVIRAPIGDFQHYEVYAQHFAELSFNLRDFKSFLSYVEHANAHVKARFAQAGKAIEFTTNVSGGAAIQTTLLLATAAPESARRAARNQTHDAAQSDTDSVNVVKGTPPRLHSTDDMFGGYAFSNPGASSGVKKRALEHENDDHDSDESGEEDFFRKSPNSVARARNRQVH